MPNLARLVREGTGGVLETMHPPLSPLVWTTMMTGVQPAASTASSTSSASTPRDGAGADHQQRAPRARDLEHGELCGRNERRRVGLWATYPAERVDGLLVSDRLFGFLFTEEHPPVGVVYPAERESVGARDARARRKADRLRRRCARTCRGSTEPSTSSIETTGRPIRTRIR